MIHITTDGSCHQSEKCGAWAAIVIVDEPGKDRYSYRVEGEEATNSSYRMEIAPIVGALDSIPKDYKGRIHITTDHASLAHLINCHVPKYKTKARHCCDMLDRLRAHTMHFRIKAEWRKGHSGDEVHEFTDRLSKIRSRCMIDGFYIP